MNTMYLTLLILSPLLGVIALFLLPSSKDQTVRRIGTVATIVPLLLAIGLYAMYVGGTALTDFAVQLKWMNFGSPAMFGERAFVIDYELSISGFSLVMLLLTTLLATIAAISSYSVQKSVKSYYTLFLLLEMGMLGVFLADNLMLFFVFFEITLVPMFFLIGKWGKFNSERASYQFLIYNGIGSAILLIVFTILFAKIGTTNIELVQHVLLHADSNSLMYSPLSENERMGLLVALIVAFGIKLPIFPLHRWMVNVHSEAPIGVVILHAGVLLKIGAYGLIRIGLTFFPAEFKQIAPILVVLGIVNLLYGAYLALIQTDFRKVLAYSSISHMGIVLMGLGALNEVGVKGAISQVISHGLIAAMLFFLVGMMEERVGTTDIRRLGGLAGKMPLLSGFLLTGAMASLGLPSMSGFISEFMVFTGLFEVSPILAAIGTLGIILTAAYLLRAVLAITFGPEGKYGNVMEFSRGSYIPVWILLVFIFLIGSWPSVLSAPIQATLDMIKIGIGG